MDGALRYAAFYRKLALTSDQIARFEQVNTNHFLQVQDIAATAKDENQTFSDPAIKELGKQEYMQFKQAATDVLGEQGFREYQQYQRTSDVGAMTDAVAGNTYFNDALNAQQAEQLTQILANNSAAYQKGQDASPNDIDFTSAAAQAQGILSPTQLAALKTLYNGEQAGRTLFQLLNTLTQPEVPPGASPAK